MIKKTVSGVISGVISCVISGKPILGPDIWGGKTKNVVGNATAPTSNSITINEVGATLSGVSVGIPEISMVVRVTGIATITSGVIDVSAEFGLGGVVGSIATDGQFSVDVVTNGGVGFKRSFASGAVATITNIKVQQII